MERSNLHRQIVHTEASVGQFKVDSARERLLALNPSIEVEAMTLLTVTLASTSLVLAETARSVTVMVSCTHLVLAPMPRKLAPAPPVMVLVS